MTKQQKLQNIKNEVEQIFKNGSARFKPKNIKIQEICLINGYAWKLVITGADEQAKKWMSYIVGRTTSAHLPVSLFTKTVEIIYK